MSSSSDQVDLIRESDRGAVIVAAAILDDSIAQLLRSVFEVNDISNKQVEKMFDLSGPLSGFAAKTLIAYAFGLISKTVFEDLNRVRSLRNEFAHSSVVVDFHAKEVVESVKSLHCVKTVQETFKAQRYSVPKEEAKSDWELLSKGYVKDTKALFAIGVKELQIDILHQHHAAVLKAQLLRESSISLRRDAAKPGAAE